MAFHGFAGFFLVSLKAMKKWIHNRPLQHKYAVFAVVVALVFTLDQISKTLVRSTIALNDEIALIPGFLYVADVENTGLAFSFLRNYPSFLIILLVLALLGYLIYSFIKKQDALTLIGLAMMVGGTLGNLFDRIMLGGVVDFIHFVLFGISMPIFNLADTFIFFGICFWILGEIFEL